MESALYTCRTALYTCKTALYTCRTALYACRTTLYACRTTLYACRTTFSVGFCTCDFVGCEVLDLIFETPTYHSFQKDIHCIYPNCRNMLLVITLPIKLFCFRVYNVHKHYQLNYFASG